MTNIVRASASSWHTLSRRRLMMLSAGATAGILAGMSLERATAALKLDITSGNTQPIPIAVPDFASVATQEPAAGRNVSQVIASNLQRSVCSPQSIRPPISKQFRQSTRCPALPSGARSMHMHW